MRYVLRLFKISKSQELPGLRPLGPHYGFALDPVKAWGQPPDPLASSSVAPPITSIPGSAPVMCMIIIFIIPGPL
jgi:hypothetical protein